MENKSVVKGYKVFNPDWTCRGKQYTCPGKFEEDVDLSVCKRGMHFCKRLIDCFNYYDFKSDNKVAEVKAYGNVVSENGKSCTDKLEIIKELNWHEVLDLVNLGKSNQGLGNTGHLNEGDYNTGSGNNGSINSGSFNTGSFNTGKLNIGDCNTGNKNIGNFNTGNFNIGHYNIGDFNKTDYSFGCFCTETPTNMYFFNKPSLITYDIWCASEARDILYNIPQEEFVRQKWWNIGLTVSEKQIILSLSNFDADIFKEITGIDVYKEV